MKQVTDEYEIISDPFGMEYHADVVIHTVLAHKTDSVEIIATDDSVIHFVFRDAETCVHVPMSYFDASTFVSQLQIVVNDVSNTGHIPPNLETSDMYFAISGQRHANPFEYFKRLLQIGSEG